MPKLRFNWPRNRVDQVLVAAWIVLPAGLGILLAGIALPSPAVKLAGALVAGLGTGMTLLVALAGGGRRG